MHAHATRHERPRARAVFSPLAALGLAACSGVQSALDPAGAEAERVAVLFWIMVGGGAAIWFAVVGMAVVAVRGRRHGREEQVARWFLLGGGVAFPVVALGVLLGWGLSTMSDLRAAEGQHRIAVAGEQWWWRVTYETPQGPVESANALVLPAGRAVALELSSPDVIHSFWIPPLGGKMDMIPGRTTRLVLEATKPGRYRGVCAEYCGVSHALMAFPVEVLAPADFEAWLADESEAAVPGDAVAEGAALFEAVGCGACHAVRGTAAAGTIGPDLTHVASRGALAAGTLPMTREAMERWIAEPAAIKPGALMPGFAALGPERIAAIASYLMALE